MRLADSQRFMRKVKKLDNGCWEWQGAVSAIGYGRFSLRKPDGTFGPGYAHRWAYQHYIGAIPVGQEIDHLCRNRRCCNPEHLRTVTHRENMLCGDTVASRNAAKTHCKRGHEFTEENTCVSAAGGRACRTCRREYMQTYLPKWRSEHEILVRGQKERNTYSRRLARGATVGSADGQALVVAWPPVSLPRLK